MSKVSGASKRRYRRQTVRITVVYLSNTGLHSERATTLGAGGLFIQTDSPMAAGSLLKLRFQLSETGAHHEIEGRVVWSKSVGNTTAAGATGMGIEFLDRVAANALALELEDFDRSAPREATSDSTR
jgi:uncharacterized protein (TIGR02266 family)